MSQAKKYAGDVSAKQAFEALKEDTTAYLIDVRTKAECHYVGVVDNSVLAGKVIYKEFRSLPGMEINSNFSSEIAKEVSDSTAKIFFLCRTGGRSREAAQIMTERGFANCFNIANGFEGDLDARQHRGNVNGWKAEGLAWRQD
jgi:rhodanese-related sulfurtransferase